MKKLFAYLFAATTMISCSKTEFQQTTDTIKRADSLFTKANEGFRTLDSISKTINDSNGIAKKVIIPEIEKQKKAIDSTLKTGNYRIDSINKELEKITKNVKTGTEVVKTLDSANKSIQSGENPLVVLTRTADRILRQTKKQSQSPSQTPTPTQPAPQTQPKVENPGVQAPVVVPPVVTVQKNPVIKSGELQINVENLNDSKALLRQQIRDNNGDIVTEKFSNTEGIMKDFITLKVPLSSFDRLMNEMQNNLGNVKMKSTETEGTDYISDQMCDIQITLIQNEKIADLAPISAEEKKSDNFGNESSGAFMKGFDVLKKAFIFLLPFWPVLLIALLVWYFVNRSRKKKITVEQPENIVVKKDHTVVETYREEPVHKPSETGEDPYEKYKPKS